MSTPVVVEFPGQRRDWEQHAGIEEIARIARTAEELGFHHLTCSEHVAVAADSASGMLGGSRGATYWDPLATLSYLAAETRRIRLTTSVLVLGYHHPLAIAKRYGTLDRISGGRLVLGLGVGSAAEEFALLGAPFADRGERADDALRALRAGLSRRMPSYEGTHYRFSGLVVDPHALQQRVPLWVGGNSVRAVRRATTLADGWLPVGLGPRELRARLERHPVPRPDFEVVAGTVEELDPVADPDTAEAVITELGEAGATMVTPRLAHRSLRHYLEQLAALAALPCYQRSY